MRLFIGRRNKFDTPRIKSRKKKEISLRFFHRVTEWSYYN